MKISEIKQRILNGINDDPDNPVFFTDAQLNTLIDEARDVIALQTRSIRQTTFLPLREGTAFYNLRNLAPDLLIPNRIWNHSNSSRLSVTSMEELDQFQQRWQDTTGDPESWFSVSWDIIGLYPRPSASGGILRIDYYAWPRAIVVDDNLDPVENPDDSIVHYGVYLGLLKQWDTERAVDAFEKFASSANLDKAHAHQLRQAHRSYARTQLDFPSSIRTEGAP